MTTPSAPAEPPPGPAEPPAGPAVPPSGRAEPPVPAEPAGAGGPPARAGRPPAMPRAEPAERGRLHISPLVVRRIAEHVANCSPGTVPARARRGGRPGRGGAAARGAVPAAAARVRSNGNGVEVELDVSLVYPQPVRDAAQRLRSAVADEVGRLTGRQVRAVAVTVVGLRPEHRPRVE